MAIHFHPKMTQGQAKALAMRLGASIAIQHGRTVLLHEPQPQPRPLAKQPARPRSVLAGAAPWAQLATASNSDNPEPPTAA